jgi:hypothetical protein
MGGEMVINFEYGEKRNATDKVWGKDEDNYVGE